MNSYTLLRSQKIYATINEVWDFFSSPENLDALTPNDMGFEITSELPLKKMHKGQIIKYKVRPILNIPLYWKTKITEVDTLNSFVDFQLKGPYKLWKHTHSFVPKDDHIIMEDKVEYILPFGPLGRLAHKLFIGKKLNNIFDYRIKKVDQYFNTKPQ